jgi:hypothetical protein
VEALQFPSNTQSNWSSGSIVCFPSWGSALCVPGDAQTHYGTGILLIVLSRYIGDPDVIRSLASPPFSGWFTKLPDNNVKNQRLHSSSVGTPLGFVLTMWRADSIAHHMPSPVPFHSLQALLLLATQWPVRAPVKLLGGSPVEALQFHSNTQSHWSLGSTLCFPSRGSVVRILGMHKHIMEPGFSC